MRFDSGKLRWNFVSNRDAVKLKFLAFLLIHPNRLFFVAIFGRIISVAGHSVHPYLKVQKTKISAAQSAAIKSF